MTTPRELLFLLLMTVVAVVNTENEERPMYSQQLETTGWMPVGRGDPLKNDPTYDYSPPVLDTVKYWADGTERKDKTKTDILLLGVPSRKSLAAQFEAKNANRRYHYPEYSSKVIYPPRGSYTSNHIHPHYSGHDGYYRSPHYHHWYPRDPVDSYVEPSVHYTTIIRPKIPPHMRYHHYTAPQSSYMDKIVTKKSPMTFPPPPSTTTLPIVTTEDIRQPYLQTLLHSEASPFGIHDTAEHPVFHQDSAQAESINSLLQTTQFTTLPPPSSTVTTIAVFPTAPPTTTTEEITTATSTTTVPTTPPSVTMGPPSMTTDALFSHYKQPQQPLRGPMYLIIEGHSKVKTYGQNGSEPSPKFTAKIKPVTVKGDPVVRHVTNDEDGVPAPEVKHLHQPKRTTTTTKPTKASAMSSLLSFLDTSFGGLLIEEEPESADEPQDNSIEATNRHRRQEEEDARSVK